MGTVLSKMAVDLEEDVPSHVMVVIQTKGRVSFWSHQWTANGVIHGPKGMLFDSFDLKTWVDDDSPTAATASSLSSTVS